MLNINHIAFIPDGNRRFAKENKLTTFEGHRRGYSLFENVIRWSADRGVKEVTFWGFSTENWKRAEEEVGFLLDLFLKFIKEDFLKLSKDGARLRIIGRRKDLTPEMNRFIERAEKMTENNVGIKVNILFNYGGQAELLDAAKNILDSGISSSELTEEKLSSFLWSASLSNPDLIIRTSNEQRLSGLLPWQSGYSELFFSEIYWPEFSENELDRAIEWFSTRERRFGGNGSK
jgi:undecaprenyl diphosphate synthase